MDFCPSICIPFLYPILSHAWHAKTIYINYSAVPIRKTIVFCRLIQEVGQSCAFISDLRLSIADCWKCLVLKVHRTKIPFFLPDDIPSLSCSLGAIFYFLPYCPFHRQCELGVVIFFFMISKRHFLCVESLWPLFIPHMIHRDRTRVICLLINSKLLIGNLNYIFKITSFIECNIIIRAMSHHIAKSLQTEGTLFRFYTPACCERCWLI